VKTSARAPKSPLRTEAPTDTRRDPRRTNVRPNGSSHRRCRRRRPGAIVGWRPERGSVQYGTLRDAVKRPAAAFDPARCNELTPRGPARRRETFGGAQPTAELDHRSGARSLLAPSSCPKVSPPPHRPCRESLANSPVTGNREQLRWPEDHLHLRNPQRRADARRPPCGGLPTPEPARSSKHWTPD